MDDNLVRRLERFLDNHWPHMESRVGRLEGEVKVLLGISVLGLGGIVTILVKVLSA